MLYAHLTPAEQYEIEDRLPVGNDLRAKVIRARLRKSEMSGIKLRITEFEVGVIRHVLPYFRPVVKGE